MRVISDAHENNNTKWTKAEDKLLRALVRQRVSCVEISNELDRSQGSIRAYVAKMGITYTNGPPINKNPQPTPKQWTPKTRKKVVMAHKDGTPVRYV